MAKLFFYYSVMGGGKTTSLLQTEYAYRQNGFMPLIIKPTIDDREGAQHGWGPISSRVLTGKHQALYVDSITPDTFKGLDFNILLVDEAQFFKAQDIEALSDIVDKRNIPVLCYGLKTDANGNLFEGAAKLLAMADEIKEIERACKCGQKAIMHVRYINGKVDKSGQAIAVEKGNVTYESLCRQCWKQARERQG